MHYPILKTLPVDREAITTFLGLNQREDLSAGEFAQMENLTAAHFPLAATCRQSAVWKQGCPQGMVAKEQLCHVSDRHLYVGADSYDLGLSEGEKQLVSMGAYLLIFPDKVYFNTADPEDFGAMEARLSENRWHLTPCDPEGVSRTVRYAGEQAGLDATAGDFWYDTSGLSPKLRRYDGKNWLAEEGFVKLRLDYYRSTSAKPVCFPEQFATGDSVRLTVPQQILEFDQDEPLAENLTTQAVRALSGEVSLKILDETSVVIPGLLPEAVSIGNYLEFHRALPELDFVFECGNRLWGCRYGDQGGSFVNEIYASRLGDFRNWRSFQGVSTDAYVAAVGTDGAFTAGMNYRGSPLFFKENCLHRVYGSYPAQYSIQTTPGPGVASQCHKSLCMLGDTALYLGRNGVCAYDGAMPSPVAKSPVGLGAPACAGVLGERYCLSTPQGLFVLDSRRGLWHRCSPQSVTEFCVWDGQLLYGDREKDAVMALDAGQEMVPFHLTTGLIAGANRQRVRSICLRYALRGCARVLVEYDSSGSFTQVGTLPQSGLSWTHLPLRPRRCDHFRLKLEGEGALRLHSIQLALEKGSDLP